MEQKQAYRIAEFCTAYGIGRSRAYQEIRQGRLKIFKVGKATLISAESADAWRRLCESETEHRNVAA